MSWQTFEANRSAIQTDVTTILKTKRNSRRLFRVTACYERRTARLVAEVVRTSYGPVVVIFDAEHGSGSEPLIALGRRRRSVAPFTGDPMQQFVIKGRSTSYVVTGAHISGRAYPGGALVFR